MPSLHRLWLLGGGGGGGAAAAAPHLSLLFFGGIFRFSWPFNPTSLKEETSQSDQGFDLILHGTSFLEPFPILHTLLQI